MAVLEATGMKASRLGELGKIWMPSRFARSYASPNEAGLPYLRPYDVFDYLPVASDHLSVERNNKIEQLILREGMILQTCSGRNLGPCAYVDKALDGFALSHDMARIEIGDVDLRTYVLTYLKTNTGQALLRRGKSGSVIDHLTAEDIGAVPIVFVEPQVREEIIRRSNRALELISTARVALRALLDQQALRYSAPARTSPTKSGWTVRVGSISDRLDAAFYDPLVRESVEQVEKVSGPVSGTVAQAHKPQRYNRYYVTPEHGRPILSGRQLLQIEPVNIRHVSDRSFSDPESYALSSGMVIFGAVGRAEGRLGVPSLVNFERHGWLASEDVARLIPRDGVSPGALWLAVSAMQSQLQIKSLSFGSVIDHMDARDIDSITLPPLDEEMGKQAEHAWDCFAEANAELSSSIALLQNHLA
ncbi:hypothetical protein [Streptomyces sp. NPDC058622]|uniref:hypothetical protein n=1 Tax=Streptomyces sp. NPDC058622 TaxID=3346562 RepID=UPI0036491368